MTDNRLMEVNIKLVQYEDLGKWYAESPELGNDFKGNGDTMAEAFNKALSNLVLVKIEEFIKERVMKGERK